MNVHSTIEAVTSWSGLDTAGKIRAIQDVYSDNHHNTASSMASILSAKLQCHVTRGSVIGIYHRHRLKGLQDYPLQGDNPNVAGSLRNRFFGLPKVIKERVIRPPVVKKTKVAPIKNLTPPKGQELPLDMRFSAAPKPFLKTLLEMESGECKWPVEGDRAQTRFCCHEADQGRSYCTFHHDLSRGDGTPSERAAHRTSKRNASAWPI